MSVYNIGTSAGYGVNSKIAINVNNSCIESSVLPLMKMWEETSYRLELKQTMKACADSEFESLSTRSGAKYKLTFDPDRESLVKADQVVKVAVLREEGTNGDREMAAALVRVGFKVWDVTMQDLISGDISLNDFRGVIFPGGFSYAGKYNLHFTYLLFLLNGIKKKSITHRKYRGSFTSFKKKFLLEIK